MNPTSDESSEAPTKDTLLNLDQNSTGTEPSLKNDQEALQAIGMLESEDNPSIEPAETPVLPVPATPYEATTLASDGVSQVPEGFSDQTNGQNWPDAASQDAIAQHETAASTEAIVKKTEGPIISGPQKSSKLLIVILILIIILIAGGTVAYLKSTGSF